MYQTWPHQRRGALRAPLLPAIFWYFLHQFAKNDPVKLSRPNLSIRLNKNQMRNTQRRPPSGKRAQSARGPRTGMAGGWTELRFARALQRRRSAIFVNLVLRLP